MNHHTTILNELEIPIEYFIFASYLNVQIYVPKTLAALNSRLVLSSKNNVHDHRVSWSHSSLFAFCDSNAGLQHFCCSPGSSFTLHDRPFLYAWFTVETSSRQPPAEK